MFDGFNKDGAGINFNHDHDVVVSCLGAVGKFTGLVSEDGVTGVVHLGEDVALLAAVKLWRSEVLQRDSFGLGGAHVLPGLVEMTLRCFNGFGVILIDVAWRE